MSLQIAIRPQAEADLAEAFAWYEAQRAGLGSELFSEIRATLSRVQQGPERYPITLRDVRRALVRRFPYSIYFVVRESRVVVLAILHHRRSPDALRKRTSEE